MGGKHAQRVGVFMDNSNFVVSIFELHLLKSFAHLMYIQHLEKRNDLRVNLRSILHIYIMSHFSNIFTMGVIAYLSFFEAWMIMAKVHKYPSTFNTIKITTFLVYWALAPTRDMDYPIRESLETYFKLSSFTLEQISSNNFCWECLHCEQF
jgi:hypothetical protein